MPGGPIIVPGALGTSPHPFETPQEREAREQEEAAAGRAEALQGLSPQTSPEVEGIFSSAYQAAQEPESWRGKAAQIFRDSGVPMQSDMTQQILQGIDAKSEEFDDDPTLFDALVNSSMTAFQDSGILTVTPYSAGLQESGFGFDRPEFNTMKPGPGLYGSENAFIHNFGEYTKDYVVEPTSGWKQFKNGTLVNPNYEIGNINAVLFDPTSRAPGSSIWMNEVVPTWSQGKVNEWRGKLIEGGYLASDSDKGIVDGEFLNAMRQYQTVRYQNNGTPMAIGPTIPGASGNTPFDFQQLRGQIDNGVREMWDSIYGQQPDDDEVEPIRDMIIKISSKLYKRGQLSSQAAVAEAEERAFTRVQQAPEAQFVTQNTEENTELRDQMLRAVQVTSMMSG